MYREYNQLPLLALLLNKTLSMRKTLFLGTCNSF
nr:MAG TPA: hypothetical protein [Caudoviricetes sp.]